MSCTPTSGAATLSIWIRAKGLPARKLIAKGIPTLTVSKKSLNKEVCFIRHSEGARLHSEKFLGMEDLQRYSTALWFAAADFCG